jgi:hypothetical protein
VTPIIGVLTLLAAIPAVGFVTLYTFMPWHKSEVGRGVMISMTATTLLVGMGVLRVFFGTHYWLREALLVFVYTVVVTGLWWMFIALLRVRHKQRAEDRKL